MVTDVAFLFGAGASQGAALGILPESPPLKTELYNRLAARFPSEWGPPAREVAM